MPKANRLQTASVNSTVEFVHPTRTYLSSLPISRDDCPLDKHTFLHATRKRGQNALDCEGGCKKGILRLLDERSPTVLGQLCGLEQRSATSEGDMFVFEPIYKMKVRINISE